MIKNNNNNNNKVYKIIAYFILNSPHRTPNFRGVENI